MSDSAYWLEEVDECLLCGHREVWLLESRGAFQCPLCSFQPETYLSGPRSIFDVHFDPGDVFSGGCLYCQRMRELAPLWLMMVQWDERGRFAPRAEGDSAFVVTDMWGVQCTSCYAVHIRQRGRWSRIAKMDLKGFLGKLPRIPEGLPHPAYKEGGV